MEADAVERAITARTKAILPVHLNGRPCDMEPLLAIARRRRLLIIEDAAQALGASLDGQKAGSFGLAGCFSFYPAKILGAYGDAGAVVTNDDSMAEKIRALRNVGRSADGEVLEWGANSRLDNLQAALLDLKLKLLPGWIERRREIAALYHRALCQLPGLVLPRPPASAIGHFDVYQNYEIEADARDALRAHLAEAGVETMLPWGGRAIHQFPALGFAGLRLPNTERLFTRVLLLPMHCEISNEQVDLAVDAIEEFVEKGTNHDAAPSVARTA
jgi:dTDP-4-amino-4,6-dideoxygalactose transaminase